jgi:hypothetical protein
MKKVTGFVVVAVLAMLCLSAVTQAAVVLTVTPTTFGRIGGYKTWATGAGVTTETLRPDIFLFCTYDISDILADTSVAIVSAKLFHKRAYTVIGDTVQASCTVAQQVVDYTLDIGTASSAFHKLLVGTNLDKPALQGINICTAGDMVTNLSYEGRPLVGGYGGLQYVDVTAIVQSWASGATNYGVGISTSTPEAISGVIPYLVLTIESVPEPMTLTLLGLGAMGLLRRRRIGANNHRHQPKWRRSLGNWLNGYGRLDQYRKCRQR